MRALPVSLLACALALAGPVAGQSTLRIGTWNLEHLGFRKPAREDSDFARIGAVIRELGVDVLAVQEIGGPAPLAKLCREIGPSYSYVLGTTGGFYNDPGRISVGFVWNDDRVEMVQAADLLELPRRVDKLPIFHRIPVSAVFRSRDGGLDFRAIAVHFKAGRGASNEQKRTAEVNTLGGYITELLQGATEDRDIVVLGDFNHTYDAPAHEAFMRHGVVSYLRPAALRPTIVHFPEPIDHIALGPGLLPERIGGSLTVHGDAAEADAASWRETCSDHIPVTLDLSTAEDQDPTGTFRAASKEHTLLPAPPEPAATEEGATPGMLKVGVTVTVITDDARHRGVLAQPLGDWVILILPNNRVLALPRERVREISTDNSR